MKFNEQIFKAYDIRGKFPQEINEEFIYYLGKAVVEFFKADGQTIAVGYDLMPASLKLARVAALGVKDAKARVKNLGMIASPVFYFGIPRYKCAGGIMFTASHLAKDFAGAKVVDNKGMAISLERGLNDISGIVRSFTAEKFSGIHRAFRFQKHQDKKLAGSYLRNIFSLIDIKEFKNPIKFVADAGGGTAGPIIKKLKLESEKLKIKALPIFCNLDARFRSRDPNPLADNALTKLSVAVKNFKADFGCAFDPDADRIIFVDENGGTVNSDLISILFIKNLMVKYPASKILYTVSASLLVEESIKKSGGDAIISRRGHSPIKEKMSSENILFGNEFSGHYFYKYDGWRDSPFWAMLKLAEIISAASSPLSELIKDLKSYHNSGELNFPVKDKISAIKKIEDRFSSKSNKILKIDGVSMYFEDWWFNIRPSNTENLVRLSIESKDESVLQEKIKELERLINE